MSRYAERVFEVKTKSSKLTFSNVLVMRKQVKTVDFNCRVFFSTLLLTTTIQSSENLD
jgi:hypothetical protein